ncbi:type I DNA topoisomerase [Phocea massiliensis]|uniref:DNA topoisomerase 1 n=1 Tax=Merdimmobilis hominis TaxID=2897707 RepID=A0A938X7G7_9FIRM|nr:type I DNA topoisomerase [Merdimmobilis hominis]MBM6920601.1 type I DNA topoisomerase [Merdimmobilis hominis]
MAKKLVIVESPAKAKTIKKYLGRNYEVVASMGHVRDLPKSRLGVDTENDFAPKYINIRKQSETIKKLKAAAKDKDKIYLATDPDREGEAISWHLAQLLGVDLNEKNRVTFNEITKSGVKSGMASPRKVNEALVNSQQARRILDRLVGYKLSPFLWKKVKSGLSAGRVQSVTVRMIVDREEEIRNFVPQEYWSIEAMLKAPSSDKPFVAKFYGKDGKKIDLHTKEETDAILASVAHADYQVMSVTNRVRQKSPAPPFTTSTMQQEASRKLGFQARRTMKAAQELYEGVDVEGLGAIGLITYMRTDSLRISDEAKAAAADYIEQTYGKAYIPQTPRVYKSKNNAQDAHEAIRPSLPELSPDKVKASLTSDQYKLYKLIWERFIASQMASALLDTVAAQIDAAGYMFKASGFTVKFDGFTVLYTESRDEEKEEGGVLPPLAEKDYLDPQDVKGSQHFTQPPPRYTEASLIKELEENGIGRPSTYAATITTILGRNYVEREGKQLKPTELGEVTTKLMKEHFEQIVDADFTANMEKDLDEIEDGDKSWTAVLHSFYDGFEETLAKAEAETEGKSYRIPDEETDVVCELCGRKMVIKSGRFGKFLACPGYPECKNTKRIVSEMPGECPLCGSKILEKKSKKGKKFYGCEKNPECSFLSWDPPIAEHCPQCGKTLLKKSGRNGKIYCSNESCSYERGLKDE